MDLHDQASPEHSGPRPGRDTADSLREQAAACRRLAAAARTRAGTSSLGALADHFDEQARKLDPSSQRI
ncbi:MAG: hypothetical protein V4502_11915 [Pseudomonadota bacterium]